MSFKKRAERLCYMYIMENLMIIRDDHMKYKMFDRENKGYIK